MYATAITGTRISVTADNRRTPPKMTAPTTRARAMPMIRPGVKPSRENWLRTDWAIELAWTALNTNP